MAIQVSGTPIITDAKALNGITSIDATTAAAIGSGGVGGLSGELVLQSSNITSYTMSAGTLYVFVSSMFFSNTTYFRVTNAHSLRQMASRDVYVPAIADASGTAYYTNQGYSHAQWHVYSNSGGSFNDWTSNSSGGSQGSNTWNVYKFV